jgi:hypothetical protein
MNNLLIFILLLSLNWIKNVHLSFRIILKTNKGEYNNIKAHNYEVYA